MKRLSLTLFLFPFFLFSQEKGTFLFGLETNHRVYKPSELNKVINNIDFVASEEYDDVHFGKGINYGVNLSYNFLNHLSLGFYGEYQKETLNQNQYNYIEYLPNIYFEEIILKKMSLETFSFGLQTELLLNTFPFWKNHKFLSKIETNVKIQAGYGRSFFSANSRSIPTEDMNVNNNGAELYHNVFYSEGFQLILALKLGYIISQNNYFSSIGLKVGYQYFDSSDLIQGKDKKSLMYNQSTKLSLSGFSLGIYLTFGR